MSRLIDADKLELDADYDDGEFWAYSKRQIDDAPTIEERKTGRWIDIDSETYTWKVRCDQCGNERSMMSTQGRYPKFCEGCGAKMEVEHEN